VVQEVVELVAGQDVRARIHHGAARQVLIVGGVPTSLPAYLRVVVSCAIYANRPLCN